MSRTRQNLWKIYGKGICKIMDNTLRRKGYARIYVENPDDVEKVKAIIKELDEFEYGYLPEKLVAPFSEYPALEYTHKFDSLCMNKLTAICWHRGIKIWACDNGNNEWMTSAIQDGKGDL